MWQTKKYRDLRERLNELRGNLLPEFFSKTGDYDEAQIDCAKGYRILVHAEIEAYLEDVCRDVALHAAREWKKSRRPSGVIVSLLASYHSGWCVNDEVENAKIIEIAKSRKNTRDLVDKVIDSAVHQYTFRIGENNGIKESNIKFLVFSIGVDDSDLGGDWIIAMNNFGSSRGDVAHKSKRTTSSVNPKDEYDVVGIIMEGLAKLDRDILRVGNGFE